MGACSAYLIATLGACAVHESVSQELSSCLTVQLLHGLLTDVASLVKVMEDGLADLRLGPAGAGVTSQHSSVLKALRTEQDSQ